MFISYISYLPFLIGKYKKKNKFKILHFLKFQFKVFKNQDRYFQLQINSFLGNTSIHQHYRLKIMNYICSFESAAKINSINYQTLQLHLLQQYFNSSSTQLLAPIILKFLRNKLTSTQRDDIELQYFHRVRQQKY